MPKLTIDLPKDVNEKLKKKAKEDYRSLTNYITIQLIKLANGEAQQHQTNTNTNTNNQVIDLSALPEGTTIKAKTPHLLTPEEIEEQKKDKFLKKCRQVLGEKTYKDLEPDIAREFITLMPDSSYYDYAERIQGKSIRMAYSMSEDKQDKNIIEIKEYIDHEEGR